jgi:hypothetical protein
VGMRNGVSQHGIGVPRDHTTKCIAAQQAKSQAKTRGKTHAESGEPAGRL